MDISCVFWRDQKRLNMRVTDATTRTLAQIFMLDQTQLVYIMSDQNQVVMAEDDGTFDGYKLFANGSYQVLGTPRSTAPPAPTGGFVVPAPPAATAAAGSAIAPFNTPVLGSNPAGTGRHLFRSNSVAKPVNRKIGVVDLLGGTLEVSHTVFVSLRHGEFNVECVATKVAEAMGEEDPYTLLYNTLDEILDGEVTTEKEFWSSQTRKIKACPTSVYTEYLNGKRTKRQKTSRHQQRHHVREDVSDLEDRVQSLLAMTDCMRGWQSAEVRQPAVILPLQPRQVHTLAMALACVICKGSVTKPVVSGCCQSLLGCKTCIDEWHLNSPRCPKCQAEDGRDKKIQLRGLDSVFNLLKPITSEVEEDVSL